MKKHLQSLIAIISLIVLIVFNSNSAKAQGQLILDNHGVLNTTPWCIGSLTWSPHEFNIIFPSQYWGQTIASPILYFRLWDGSDLTTLSTGSFRVSDNGATVPGITPVLSQRVNNYLPLGIGSQVTPGKYYIFDFTGQNLSVPANGVLWFRFDATSGDCSAASGESFGSTQYTTTYQQANNPRTFGSGFTIRSNQCQSPTITCPANITVTSASGQCGANVSFAATATGNPTPTLSYSPASGSFFPIGTTTVTATATNSCGVPTCTFTVTVNDTQAPNVITQNATVNLGANGTAQVTAAQINNGSSDNCTIANYSLSQTTFTCADITTSSLTNCAMSANYIDGPTNANSGANGQTFTNLATGYLSKIDVVSFNSLQLRVRTYVSDDLATAFTGTILATSNSADGAANYPGFTSFTFPTPPLLTAGTQYIFEVVGSGVAYHHIPGGYSGGTAVSPTNPSAVRDIPFKTFICPAGVLVTLTATDGSNNSNTGTAFVSVVDNSPPTITCPANITVSNTMGQCGANVTFAASASDNCGTANITYSQAPGSFFALGTTTVTVTANDGHGNTASCSFTVTVNLTNLNLPTFTQVAAVCIGTPISTLPTTSTNGVTGSWSPALNNTATTTYTFTPNVGQCASTASMTIGVNPLPSVAITGNTTICQGSSTELTVTVPTTVVSPGLLPPGNNGTSASCDCPSGYVVVGIQGTNGAWIDQFRLVCQKLNTNGTLSGPLSYTCFSGVNPGPVLFEYLLPANNVMVGGNADYITWGANNYIHGLQGYGQTINYINNAQNNATSPNTTTSVIGWYAPSGNLGDSFVPNGSVVTGMTAYSNFYSSGIKWNYKPIGQFLNTYTWSTSATTPSITVSTAGPVSVTATDYNGCSNSASTTIIVNPLPTITCPANIVVSNTANQCGANVSFAATATGTPTPTLSYSPASGSFFPVGTTTVTTTATNNCGAPTCTFTVTVNDTQPPTISCPANIVTTNTTGLCGKVVTFAATASDNCGTATVSYSPASGSTFSIGTTTVTATANDGHGNTTSCTFTVTVNDTQAPSLAVIPTVPFYYDQYGRGTTLSSVNLGGTGTNVKTVAPNASVSLTFNRNTIKTGACPTCITQNYIGIAGVWSSQCLFSTTAASSASHSFTFTAPSTPGVYYITIRGSWEFNCLSNATMPSGPNDAFAVVIVGNGGSSCPENVVVNNDLNQCGAVVSRPSPSIIDNCPGGTVVQTTGLPSGSLYPFGTTTNTFVATDASGNTATCSYSVTVNDNQPPTISCPANISVNNTLGQCGANVTFAANASDNCGSANITYSPTSGSFFTVGTTTVTATANDGHGNTTSCTFTVTVNDTQPPVINCPANIVTTNTTGLCGKVVTFAATASDNCGTANITYSPVSGSFFAVGTTTVTATANDGHGNTTSCTFTVTVNDTQPPTINCPANINADMDPGSCGAFVNFAATASDNCGTANITYNPASGSFFNIGTTTVTATANDGHGNTTSCTFTVTVDLLDWANLQWPPNATICPGGTFTAYGQVYEPNVTTVGGQQGANIEVQFGFNSSNTNPSTWSNWSPASFNQYGGGPANDEYYYDFSSNTPGTYYYTFRYRQNGCTWQYGGFSNGGGFFWDGTNFVSGVLTVQALDWANLQWPPNATICQGSSMTAYGQVYEPGVTPGAGLQGAGIDVQFGYSTTNSNPSGWSNWSTASFNNAGGGFANDEYYYSFTPPTNGTFYYTFRYRLNNCSWQYGGFSNGGGYFWDGTNHTSGTLTVDPTTVGGTVSGGTTICPGFTSSELTLSGHTGMILRWESTTAPFITWDPIANNSTTYTSVPLSETTKFRAVLQSGVCLQEVSVETTVIVYLTYPFYADNDDDGYGAGPIVMLCSDAATNAPEGYSVDGTDCDDTKNDRHQTFPFYVDADNDTYGAGTAIQLCAVNAITPPLPNYSVNNTDCNDNVFAINPSVYDIPYDSIDNNCDGSLFDGHAPIVVYVLSPSCGGINHGLNNTINCTEIDLGEGFVIGYRFKVTNLATGQVVYVDTVQHHFKLTDTNIYAYGTPYSIQAAAIINGEVQPFNGPICTLTTTSVATTKVIPSQCGSTLLFMNSTINATAVNSAMAYRFRVARADAPTVYYYTGERNLPNFNLTMLTAPVGFLTYATEYKVDVQIKIKLANIIAWSQFGQVCSIFTPQPPATSLIASQCELVATSNSQVINATPFAGATVYRFLLTHYDNFGNIDYQQSQDSPTSSFTLSMFTGLLPGTTYNVAVSMQFYGTFVPYDKDCSVTTPVSAKAMIEIPFNAIAHPNPYNNDFLIDVKTNSVSDIDIKVFDMIGRLVEQRTVKVNDLENSPIGERYPSGVYNVIVSQDEAIKTVRVVKR